MIIICNVPDEVVKNVKMGTWCGSSVVEKMIANGVPLDKIKEEIKDNTYFINETTEKEGIDFETVEKIIDKYKAESEVLEDGNVD